MTRPPPHEVTQLLVDWSNGNQTALDRLMPLVDRELHRLARHYSYGAEARGAARATVRTWLAPDAAFVVAE